MTAASLPGILTGATALVTAIITLVKLLQHQSSANPHPQAAQAVEPPPAPGQVKAG